MGTAHADFRRRVQPVPGGKRETINRNLAILNVNCYDVLLKQLVYQSLFERHVVIPFLVEAGEAIGRKLLSASTSLCDLGQI